MIYFSLVWLKPINELKMSVYKFMAAEKPYHVESLLKNQVYFARFDELNDPYESLLRFCRKGVTLPMQMAAHTQHL